MAVTPTIVAKRRHLKGSAYYGFLVFSGSYTALGDSITAASMGLNKFDAIILTSGVIQGTTHSYFPSIVPTAPDAAGRFTAFTMPILDLVYSSIAAADLAASTYPAALTGLAPGFYFEAVGF